MRTIGIDPGLATMGIGVVDAIDPHTLTVHEWLTIQTRAGVPKEERLKEIYRDLSAYLKTVKPDVAVLEKVFFGTNIKTAIDVAEARGIALLALAEASIPVLEPTPSALKACIAGDGKADKIQMQTMIKMLLKLEEIPKPDDAADALCLAAFGALHYEKKILLAIIIFIFFMARMAII